MLIKIYSAAPVGIDAVPVTIEVHSVPGFDFTLVGLPDVAVKESHERILAALTVNGVESLRRAFTINMAPADIKKEGAAFDLPLAIGMLAGSFTKSQIVAFVLGVLACFILYWVLLQNHYSAVSRGVIDLVDVLIFVGVGVICLALTVVILNKISRV